MGGGGGGGNRREVRAEKRVGSKPGQKLLE